MSSYCAFTAGTIAMTITISQRAYWELVREVDETRQDVDPSDELDTIWQYPQHLGQGFVREIQLREGLWLAIENFQLRDCLMVDCPDREHPVEYNFMFSGGAADKYLQLGRGQYNFYGSGCVWSNGKPIATGDADNNSLSVAISSYPSRRSGNREQRTGRS